MRLGDRSVGVYPHAVMHDRREWPTGRSRRQAGSARIAWSSLRLDDRSGQGYRAPIRFADPAVRPTYAGSEMTLIYGLTEAGLKRTGRTRRVLPRTVTYDPLFTLFAKSPVSSSARIGSSLFSIATSGG